MMKLAISGKGGVGKTTLTAALSRLFASRGYTVYAVDADPDANLGLALGFPVEEIDSLTPLAELKELITERTGGAGPYFLLNPKVDDVLEKFVISREGIKLMRMGTVKKAASECYCRENAFLQAVVRGLLIDRDEVVIMDMTAGIEHLTRGTAMFVNMMLVLTEPTQISLRTALTTCALALQMGIKDVAVVGNKVRGEEDRRAIASFVEGANLREQVKVLGCIPFDEAVFGRAITSAPTSEEIASSPFWKAVNEIFEALSRMR
jgi:CO dehydrogenase maturation factor